MYVINTRRKSDNWRLASIILLSTKQKDVTWDDELQQKYNQRLLVDLEEEKLRKPRNRESIDAASKDTSTTCSYRTVALG